MATKRKKKAGKPRKKHSTDLVSNSQKRDIIKDVALRKMTVKEAAQKAHVVTRTVERWKRVFIAGGSYGGSKPGRKPLVSGERKEELKLKIGQLVTADQSPQEEKMRELIHNAAVATLTDQGLTEVARPHISDRRIRDIKKAIGAVATKAQLKSGARWHAERDFRNAISLWCVFGAAVFDDENDEEISDFLLGNIDATQLEYEKGSQDIRVYHIKGEARAQKKQRTTTRHAAKLTQRLKMWSCQFASGATAPIVIVIKEKNIKLTNLEAFQIPFLSADASDPLAVGWLWIVPAG